MSPGSFFPPVFPGCFARVKKSVLPSGVRTGACSSYSLFMESERGITKNSLSWPDKIFSLNKKANQQ
jgi:hypothetical protein